MTTAPKPASLPATAVKLPPLTACDVSLMSSAESAAHRQRICLEVDVVLKGYYVPDEPEQMTAAGKVWWADELEGWTPEQVRWAMRKWCRDNPNRRPNPGYICGLLRDSWGRKNAEQVRDAMKEPTETVPFDPDERATMMAEMAAKFPGLIKQMPKVSA